MLKRRAGEQKGIEYYMDLPYSILLHTAEEEGKKYWIAEVPELPGCKSHGLTIDEAVRNIEDAKKEWILDSLEEGDEIPTPVERDRFSGKTLVRMSRSLHRALSLLAESEKLSLNQLIVTILAKEAGRLSVLNRVEEKLDNLLDKVNDVIEQEELRISSSINLPSLIVEPHKQSQWRILVDTNTFLEAAGAAEQDIVGTALSFDELWSYPYRGRQAHGTERILFRACEEKEDQPENIIVELKQE